MQEVLDAKMKGRSSRAVQAVATSAADILAELRSGNLVVGERRTASGQKADDKGRSVAPDLGHRWVCGLVRFQVAISYMVSVFILLGASVCGCL
jgi:hypothetical protein